MLFTACRLILDTCTIAYVTTHVVAYNMSLIEWHDWQYFWTLYGGGGVALNFHFGISVWPDEWNPNKIYSVRIPCGHRVKTGSRWILTNPCQFTIQLHSHDRFTQLTARSADKIHLLVQPVYCLITHNPMSDVNIHWPKWITSTPPFWMAWTLHWHDWAKQST